MKKLSILLVLFFAGTVLYAQAPAKLVASKIAQKLKDSLQITEAQRKQIYTIKMLLHERKMAARQQFAGSPEVVKEVQMVENTRDSLYRPVFTAEQFQRYKARKRTLVSNN